jgi:hypothetical protein
MGCGTAVLRLATPDLRNSMFARRRWRSSAQTMSCVIFSASGWLI